MRGSHSAYSAGSCMSSRLPDMQLRLLKRLHASLSAWCTNSIALPHDLTDQMRASPFTSQEPSITVLHAFYNVSIEERATQVAEVGVTIVYKASN